jgi:hypothetical protein
VAAVGFNVSSRNEYRIPGRERDARPRVENLPYYSNVAGMALSMGQHAEKNRIGQEFPLER